MCYAELEGDLKLDSDRLFDLFWNARENWTEEPNVRRNGTSGVTRAVFNEEIVYIKKQTNHLHRNLRHPFGRPTALREAEALGIARKLGITVPDTLFCATRRAAGVRQTVLVTRGLYDFQSLDDFTAQTLVNSQEQEQIIRTAAQPLAKLHRNRWQHSALYAKHIMLARKGDGFEIALIDLEKMHRRLTSRQASRHDLDQLSRHQNCWDQTRWGQFLEEYRVAFTQNW